MLYLAYMRPLRSLYIALVSTLAFGVVLGLVLLPFVLEKGLTDALWAETLPRALVFGAFMGLFHFFAYRHFARRYPAEVQTPELLWIPRKTWEQFQRLPSLYLDLSQITFRTLPKGYEAPLPSTNLLAMGMRVRIKVQEEQAGQVQLHIRTLNLIPFLTETCGYEFKVRHMLRQAFGPDFGLEVSALENALS